MCFDGLSFEFYRVSSEHMLSAMAHEGSLLGLREI